MKKVGDVIKLPLEIEKWEDKDWYVIPCQTYYFGGIMGFMLTEDEAKAMTTALNNFDEAVALLKQIYFWGVGGAQDKLQAFLDRLEE